MRRKSYLLSGFFTKKKPLLLLPVPNNTTQPITTTTVVSVKPANKIYLGMKNNIEDSLKENQIKHGKRKLLMDNIGAACAYHQSQKPMQYINQFIKDSDAASLKLAYKIMLTLTKDEVIAFFELAPLGVSLESFSKHKKLFVTDPKNHSFYGGMGGAVANRFSRALEACKYLLKLGLTFDDVIDDLIAIKCFYDSDERFMAITFYELPMQYAKTLNRAQIGLYSTIQSSGLTEEKRLKKIMTLEKIAQLNIAADCNAFKLVRVLHHLLITKAESWEEVESKLRGADKHRIDEVLYSQIFRDQVKETWNVTLDDTCTWFNNEVDVKALAVVMNFLKIETKKTMRSFDLIKRFVNRAIAELKLLNASQKWIIVVGGSFDEAKKMYTEPLYKHICPALFEERYAKRDLEAFRNKVAHDENNAPPTPKM